MSPWERFFICQTTGKMVKGILQQDGVWKVKLETTEGYPEYHTLACLWDSTHTLEAKHDGNQKHWLVKAVVAYGSLSLKRIADSNITQSL